MSSIVAERLHLFGVITTAAQARAILLGCGTHPQHLYRLYVIIHRSAHGTETIYTLDIIIAVIKQLPNETMRSLFIIMLSVLIGWSITQNGSCSKHIIKPIKKSFIGIYWYQSKLFKQNTRMAGGKTIFIPPAPDALSALPSAPAVDCSCSGSPKICFSLRSSSSSPNSSISLVRFGTCRSSNSAMVLLVNKSIAH